MRSFGVTLADFSSIPSRHYLACGITVVFTRSRGSSRNLLAGTELGDEHPAALALRSASRVQRSVGQAKDCSLPSCNDTSD
jgi:hypothetical protein